MLAAIGLIIIAKQIPVLLNVDVALTKGKSPFALLGSIPEFIANLNLYATIIGVVSLIIMMGWTYIKNPIVKKIPAPLVVLLLAIPAQIYFGGSDKGIKLVTIGNFIENININVSFDGISQMGTFVKYVIMFALVGTLESLLTVKAIDMLDPFKRKSDTNKDLIAVGVGNTLAAILGGLPMISEVARSSANVNNGAKTRWANFFHGFFILTFVLLATPLIEKIPMAALAAMLISVGIKLAHPKEFIQTFKIGKEQLAIFLITIFFTLFEDLLVGIAVGILLKFIIHMINGAPISSFFKVPTEISYTGNDYLVKIHKSALFSNFIGIKNKLEQIPPGFNVTIDLENTKLVDHSVMENLHLFEHDYQATGGTVKIIGLDEHKPLSKHHLAGRKK
jgi:MFS superfamily sulfate permease-like transporter